MNQSKDIFPDKNLHVDEFINSDGLRFIEARNAPFEIYGLYDYKNQPDYKRKLWDHLAIMSDFMLDIDYPCEIIKKEEYMVAPERVPYQNGEINNRHYGRIVEQMIAHACTLEAGDERDQLVEIILIQMKKNYIAWNKEGVEDKRIIEDLRIYVKGAFEIADREIRINQNSNSNGPRNNGKQRNGKKNFKRKY